MTDTRSLSTAVLLCVIVPAKLSMGKDLRFLDLAGRIKEDAKLSIGKGVSLVDVSRKLKLSQSPTQTEPEAVREYWNSRTSKAECNPNKDWNELWGGLSEENAHEDWDYLFKSVMKVEPGGAVLDLGAGCGELLRYFHDHLSFKVGSGIDVGDVGIRGAQKYSERWAGPEDKFTFHVGDMRSFPAGLPANTFNIVHSNAIHYMHAWNDICKVLSNAMGVLQNNGRAVFVMGIEPSVCKYHQNRIKEGTPALKAWSEEAWRKGITPECTGTQNQVTMEVFDSEGYMTVCPHTKTVILTKNEATGTGGTHLRMESADVRPHNSSVMNPVGGKITLSAS